MVNSSRAPAPLISTYTPVAKPLQVTCSIVTLLNVEVPAIDRQNGVGDEDVGPP
jgi:hypothetical protein